MSNDSKLPDSGQSAATGKNAPPATNRGVTGKNERTNFRCGIDWIRYSATYGREPLFYLPSHPIFELTGEVLPRARFYAQSAALYAARVDWNDENPKQGVLVTMNGQQCQLAHSKGVDLQDVLSHAIYGVFGRLTRLDFAVDVYLPDAKPKDILEAWKAGCVTSPAQTCNNVGSTGKDGVDMGQTVYIGSRSSGRVLRVYDKAKQAGVSGSWVRIELECKAEYAQSLAKSMLVSGIDVAGKTIIREFVQIEGVDWFSEALVDKKWGWLEPIERKETDRQRWYREQIIPAIENDFSGGDEGLTRWLGFELQRLLDDYANVEQHGGVITPLENSNKAFYGVKALEERGFVGVRFRRAFEVAGKEFIVLICQQLGMTWDTKLQRWLDGAD